MPRDAIDLIEITEQVEAPNSILALFNPIIPFSQEKRKPGRPRKVQPPLPEGHMKHAMSDDDDGLAEQKSASFPLLEQRRFQQEYQYELTIMKRSPKPVLLELAALYGIDYTMAHDCVKDLPLI